MRMNFLRAGTVRTDESWGAPPRFSAFTRLYFVTGGSGVLYSEKEDWELLPDFLYICPMGLKYGFRGTPSVEKLYFHLNVLLPDGSDVFARYRQVIRLPCGRERIERLKTLFFSEEPLNHVLLQGEILHLLGEALRTAGMPPERFSPPLTAAIRFIHRNLTASLRAEDVAEAVFLSRSALNTLFQKEIGQPVSRYIDELVMSEAQVLLQYSRLSVGEISDRLGFSDRFYFSRKCSRFFGKAPSRMRGSGAG